MQMQEIKKVADTVHEVCVHLATLQSSVTTLESQTEYLQVELNNQTVDQKAAYIVLNTHVSILESNARSANFSVLGIPDSQMHAGGLEEIRSDMGKFL